jgi:hypothetical protein
MLKCLLAAEEREHMNPYFFRLAEGQIFDILFHYYSGFCVDRLKNRLKTGGVLSQVRFISFFASRYDGDMSVTGDFVLPAHIFPR